MKTLRGRRGINTIEMLLAITLFSVLVMGSTAFQLKCLGYLRQLRVRAHARDIALNVAENLASGGYDALPVCEDAAFEYPGIDSALAKDAECTYSAREFDPARPGLKVVRVTVAWNFIRPHPTEVATETLLAARYSAKHEESGR